MYRRTSRLNHVLLVLIGLVLLAAGAFLIARHYGWISQLPSSDRLYSKPEARWIHAHDWIWYVVAGVAIVVGLIAVWWLFVQPRIDRLRALFLDAGGDQAGRTTLAADALTDQIEDDIADHPGVTRARVLITGRTDRPVVVVRVSTHAGGDIESVRRHLADTALPAARTALEAEALPVQVHLLVAGKTEQRVVE